MLCFAVPPIMLHNLSLRAILYDAVLHLGNKFDWLIDWLINSDFFSAVFRLTVNAVFVANIVKILLGEENRVLEVWLVCVVYSRERIKQIVCVGLVNEEEEGRRGRETEQPYSSSKRVHRGLWGSGFRLVGEIGYVRGFLRRFKRYVVQEHGYFCVRFDYLAICYAYVTC